MKPSDFRCGILSALVVAALAAPATSNAQAPAGQDAATRLQQVADHIEIERVLMEYGRALDLRDFDTYSQLFATNGEWSGSIGTFRGPAAIKAAMLEAFKDSKPAAVPTNFHVLSNPIIDVKGDRATAWSRWTFISMVDKKPVVTLAGEYEDTLIRENGKWKFLRRTAKTPG